ncbi:MAG: FAD-dependent oxidoreductase [Acidobacteria bacterium]|nr:FAD-dependent oxidoreductase [Acidobacteriota bacterium]
MSGGNPDVVIIGAGIVGAAIAERLSAERLKVIVVEADCAGSGATAAGMGHVVVMDDSEAQFALTAYSRRLWQEKEACWPKAAEYRRPGTLWVAADAEEFAAVEHKHAWYGAHGVQSEILTAGDLAREEPQLRPGLAGALRVPEDMVVYPPAAARWLVERARRQGAVYMQGARVEHTTGSVVTLASGTVLHTGGVIHAAGAQGGHLPVTIPVAPRKGHLAITDRAPGFLRHQIVELGYLKSAHGHETESVACNLQPRATGQVLIGSSRQYGVHTAAVELPMLHRMLRRALEYMPGLAGLPVVRTWTGFRAATPDGLPLIGRAPQCEGLWLATGHEGLGITTSLATAELLAAQMLGREAAIPAEPYSPSRFGEKSAHA